MGGGGNLKSKISSLGQLFFEVGYMELLFACILNHKVAPETRRLTAWCAYEAALWVERPLEECRTASCRSFVISTRSALRRTLKHGGDFIDGRAGNGIPARL